MIVGNMIVFAPKRQKVSEGTNGRKDVRRSLLSNLTERNLSQIIRYERRTVLYLSSKLAIPRSKLRGHLIEGGVREAAGFSAEQLSFIPISLLGY